MIRRRLEALRRHLWLMIHALRRGGFVSAARRWKNFYLDNDHVTPLTRYNVWTVEEALNVLPQLVRRAGGKSGVTLIVGGASPEATERTLASRIPNSRVMDADRIRHLQVRDTAEIAGVVLATFDAKTQQTWASRLKANPATASLPLEYVALPRAENSALLEWDKYINGDFVSPLLVRHGSALYAIYSSALHRFRLKTDIRDYLDLCQSLQSVIDRNIAGAVAEFGSFRGHSGYLISKTLEQFSSEKALFMFDTFDTFPDEPSGVDRFWSGTHKVNFENVKAKFQDRANVRFVQGDFTRTLAQTDTGPLALAFIDCDSYRATQYLLDELWHRRLTPGGIVVLEDYGHAALLGNRLAVHEFFDGRADAFTYYSQFSGFFVALKLSGG